jgi:hypothetical protein
MMNRPTTADATRYKMNKPTHERANSNPGAIEYSSERADASTNDNESNEEYVNTSSADAIEYHNEQANATTNGPTPATAQHQHDEHANTHPNTDTIEYNNERAR